MNKRTDNPFAASLHLGRFRAMQGELTQLRLYPAGKRNGRKVEGGILPFVQGLYFSALVAYRIREILSKSGKQADWGHIVHMNRPIVSRECDIIIHNDGTIQRWNGHILDFHFVEAAKALAVVSCKSHLASIETYYAKELLNFGVKSVILFAEECNAKDFDRLQKKAKANGYKDLYVIAKVDKKTKGLAQITAV